jgi:uncharacterized protein (TIGR03067 family)
VTGHLTLALVWGLLHGAAADAAKDDHARFEGVWSFAKVEVDGKEQPPPPFPTNKILIRKDGRYVVVQGPRITHGVVKLDPSQTPPHFDVIITQGPAKNRKLPCIYELGADTYKLCGPYGDAARPTTFASKPGSGLVLQVLKREKQDLKEALIEVARRELAGTWQAVSYALDGTKASDEDMKRVKLVFDGEGKTQALQDGKVFIASSTTIEPLPDPMRIDITFTAGGDKGRTALGIYRIDDDVLTICRAAPGKARPTTFASEGGSGHTLMTYRRERPTTK